jgi:hypothetical protein
MLRVLRQLRDKDEGAGCRTVPCHAVPGHAAHRSAWRCVLHNCRKFMLDRNAGSGKNTRWARTTFLRDFNLLLYHLRYTYLENSYSCHILSML